MIILETERLRLEEAELTDAPFFYELMNSPTWIQFIGDRNIKTIEDAENHILNKMQPSYKEFGFGFYKIVVKANGKSVGTCGLIKRPNLDHVDIGYALLPQHEKNGYAIESATALMDHATNVLKIYPILGVTTMDNYGSHKILEKIGLKRAGTIPWGEEKEESLLFSNERVS
jgi:RimJ/RimL family protein N-acetyltransferase